MEENRTYGQIFEAVKSEDVKTAVLQNQKVILDYTAKWCNPCKKLEPVLKNFASTFAPVPKYKKITERNIPSIEFPALRLAEPINFYPTSFSSWRKKIKLNI